MRRQVLGNPQVMADLRRVRRAGACHIKPTDVRVVLQTNPELADAAQNDPARFRDLLGQLAAMQESARLQREREMQLLEADPFDVEAQKKIEEAIRQERVLENMEQAMEDMPESCVSSRSLRNVHVLTLRFAAGSAKSTCSTSTSRSTECRSRRSSTRARKGRSVSRFLDAPQFLNPC